MPQLSSRSDTPLAPKLLRSVELFGWLLPLALLLCLLVLIESVVSIERQSARHDRLSAVNEDLASLASVLTYELNATQYFSLGLKAYIETNNGLLDEKSLAPWLTELQARGAHIRNIALAPGNRISYIYPLAGNEGALGLYYPDEPTQWPGVKAVIETRQPKLIGPFELRQGGRGLVYREAIYLSDGRYWGIVSSVINSDSLFAALLESARQHSVDINIYDREQGQWLLAAEGVRGELQERIAIPVAGRQWELAAGTAAVQVSSRVMLLRIGGWLVSLLSAYLLLRFMRSFRERARVNLALEQSQKRFKRVFASSPQAMALIDDQHHWLEVNASFCLMMGWQADEFNGKTIADLFVPAERERIANLMQEIRNAYAIHSSHFQQFEAQLESHTAAPLMGLVSLGICYHTPDKTHWILQIIDISERIRLENLKRDFVSVVSHELRTPLTSILGGLKLLASGQFSGFDERATKIIQIALQNGERLSLLINDLLDMEKLIAGKVQFDLQRHNLPSLLARAVEAIEPYAAQYNIALEFNPPDTALWVEVDDLRLIQVVTNLLSNGVKFSPPGARVTLGIELHEQQVRVFVRDQGEGIAAADQGKLFKHFSQVDSSSTRKKGGTGLGLAISKELIEAMQGSIGYMPAPDKGAYFYFELPLVNKLIAV